MNIHQRIRLIYGEPFGLSIESQAGEGTVVGLELGVELPQDAEAFLSS